MKNGPITQSSFEADVEKKNYTVNKSVDSGKAARKAQSEHGLQGSFFMLS